MEDLLLSAIFKSISVSIHDNYSIFPLCNGLSDHEAQLIVLSDVKVNARNIFWDN
jgi:hypothetical protein